MPVTDRTPDVLIVGGFATVPPNYWPFARRLRSRARSVSIAPIWTPDWVLASVLGFGPIMRRTRRAVIRAYLDAGRRPIMVIAHSGGGISARLAMANVPFHGRIGGAAEAVGCLVTLGTPHGLGRLINRYRHAGHEACSFLDRESPGAFFAPRTGYVSVGSLVERGSLIGEAGTFAGIGGPMAKRIFSIAVGDDTATKGDGVVPAAAAHLEGAEQITFDDVTHGMIGSPWYGDEEIIERWWPTALREWHAALEARRSSAAAPPSVEDSGSGANGRKPLELEVAGWSSGSSSGS